ncbi:MAG: ExbD/TolR family protein [bacterium JZ-2024 1]
MKRRFSPGVVSVNPRIELTPMVDMVLNLLVFFAVTTTLIATQRGMPLNLPEATSGEKLPARIVISLNQAGQIFWENSPVTLAELEGKLTQLAEKNPQIWVFINADRSVLYDKVIEVIDVARKVKGVQFALAVKPKQ